VPLLLVPSLAAATLLAHVPLLVPLLPSGAPCRTAPSWPIAPPPRASRPRRPLPLAPRRLAPKQRLGLLLVPVPVPPPVASPPGAGARTHHRLGGQRLAHRIEHRLQLSFFPLARPTPSATLPSHVAPRMLRPCRLPSVPPPLPHATADPITATAAAAAAAAATGHVAPAVAVTAFFPRRGCRQERQQEQATFRFGGGRVSPSRRIGREVFFSQASLSRH
jgi:hypothetical protein